MKKSLVAVGVIAAVGVVWTGTSWYTGKQLEQRIAQAVADANAQIRQTAPQSGLLLSYQDYQRGLFSSQLKLTLKADPAAQKSWLPAGSTILLDEKVDHGPFPASQLKKFNLLPAMASVQTTLIKNETTKSLFESTGGKSFIDADTRISYGGDTSSDIALRPLELNHEKNKVVFGGGEFTADVSKRGETVTLKGEVGNARFTGPNEYGQQVGMAIDGFNIDGETNLTDFKVRVGNQKLNVDKLTLSIEGKDMAILDGLTLNAVSQVEKDGKHLGGQLDYNLKALQIQNQNMGSGSLMLKASRIDGAALHEFSQRYNAQAQALLAEPGIAEDPERYQQRAADILLTNLPVLLKGEPQVSVTPLSWKNDKGESTLRLDLTFRQPPQHSQAQTPQQAADGIIKTMDGNLTIPMPMAKALMTQVAKLQGYQEDQAEKLADQQVRGLAAMGTMFHLTKQQDDSITSVLKYASGQIELNGEKMPLEAFQGMFGLPLDDGRPAQPEQPQALPPQSGGQ
ncbi:DUF945 family protein [Erwinia sp. CPCC 100877]|nr:DUF945 family protein [Erwinia sp. CPCC 100877]